MPTAPKKTSQPAAVGLDSLGRPKQKPPGGKRPTKAMQDTRFQAVRAAMVAGYSTADIVASFDRDWAPDGDHKLGGPMPERTVADYQRLVRESWKVEFAAEWATRRERQLRRLQGHVASCVRKGDLSAAAQHERLIAQIEGNLAPVVFERKPAGRGWDQLKDDELEELRTKGKLPDGVSVEDLDRAN